MHVADETEQTDIRTGLCGRVVRVKEKNTLRRRMRLEKLREPCNLANLCGRDSEETRDDPSDH